MQLSGGDHERRRDLKRDPAQEPGDDASPAGGGDDARAEARVGFPRRLTELDGAEQARAGPHLADEFVPRERRERGMQRRLKLPHALHELLAFDDVKIRQADSAGRRMR